MVRKGLSALLYKLCVKSLLEATGSAFKYSHLTHPNTGLKHRAAADPNSGFKGELVCWLNTALDSMNALLFTCLLVPWLVAASARRFDQESQLIMGSVPGKDLSGYFIDHLKSRRARVRNVFIMP